MGTWGTSIFADDLAADVRGDWRNAITDGMSPEEATRALMERFGDAAADPDEEPRFWMALAAAQCETGRLVDFVRGRALQVIETGADVEQFEPRDQGRRKKAIADLAAKLRGPQRAPVKLTMPKPRRSPAAVGDVIRVHRERRSALFVVVKLADGWPPGSEWPVVVGLRTEGDVVLSPEQLLHAPLVREQPVALFRPRVGDVAIHYRAISGPSRGPRAFATFGEVVAHSIFRPDAPPVPEGQTKGAMFGYADWRGLAREIDGEWYDRMLALTDKVEVRQSRGWRALASRLRRRSR